MGTFASEYDLAGRRRTKLTWPDTFYVTYDYLLTGEMAAIRESGATSGVGVLVVFGYDPLGRRSSLTRGNGTVTNYAHDPLSRLSQLSHDVASTTRDLTLDFAYTPASQIASTTRSNDDFAWTGHGSGTTTATTNGVVQSANGLNQIGSWAGSISYDSKGNVITHGSSSYGFSSEDGGGTTCAPGDPSCEITITGERPVRDLRNCEADFAGRQFTLGMSWDLRNVQFRYGRDSSTNISSQKALDTGAGAVTQYSVIYVNPDSWARITNPNNSAFWEEVFHTTQFSKYGSLFYIHYGASSVAAKARGEDIYNGNAFEREAKEWANMLALRYRESKPCAN